MLLSDMGAGVLRIDRPGTSYVPADVEARGRHYVQVDLKDAQQRAQVLALVARGETRVEGFRPGVRERLGLGPEVALRKDPPFI